MQVENMIEPMLWEDVCDVLESRSEFYLMLAGLYFNGPDNSLKKPGTLFFGGYAAAARAAWLRG